MKKWCKLYGMKYIEVKAAYSSFIGCMLYHKDIDSVAAACEIARRGYYELTTGLKCKVLPDIFDIALLPTQWKNMVVEKSISSWLEFYKEVKESKRSYRLLFEKEKMSKFLIPRLSYMRFSYLEIQI